MRTFSLITLLTIGVGLYGQSRMSSSEISHLYDTEHEFTMDEQVARDGHRYKVFLRFRLNSSMVKISDYELSYDLRTSYIDEKMMENSVRLDSSHLVGNGYREFTYAIEFETTEEQNLLVIQIDNLERNRRYYKDIALSSASSRSYAPFLIFPEGKKVPYFEKYLNAGTQVSIQNIFGEATDFSIRRSKAQKRNPMPPFSATERPAEPELAYETVYEVAAAESFTLNTPGFYQITAAKDETKTIGMLVTDAAFPYFEEYEALIQPLIYISTEKEFTAMRNADNTKSGFENFVLETISGNTKIAQEFVKYYYRRIRKSAQLFTTNLEGWKTDRGMIYQIFGDPANVFRNETTELWVYAREGGKRLRFTFDILKEPAGIRQYKLLRGEKYRKGWMNAVIRWRSGQIIE